MLNKLTALISITFLFGSIYVYISSTARHTHQEDDYGDFFAAQYLIFRAQNESNLWQIEHILNMSNNNYPFVSDIFQKQLAKTNDFSIACTQLNFNLLDSLNNGTLNPHTHRTIQNLLKNQIDSLKQAHRINIEYFYTDIQNPKIEQILPQKNILANIDTAFLGISKLYLEVPKMSFEELRLYITMINCEIQRLLAATSINYLNLIIFNSLEFDKPYIIPWNVFSSIELGDTLKGHIEAKYAEKYSGSCKVWINTDTLIAQNGIYNYPLNTDKIGVQKIHSGITIKNLFSSYGEFEYQVIP